MKAGKCISRRSIIWSLPRAFRRANSQSTDSASVVVLRFLGALFGIAQFILVFLSLRLLLPVRAALIGVLLAAFLPMHLYLAHYVTNEMLAAALATTTLYLCLRLLKSDAPRASQFGWLGLALGAAMLSKATGILLLPIVIAAIAGKLAHARAPIASSLRNLGLLVAICFAVCGWHYARIWLRFGTPLLGNWDVLSGFTWWQDPGYHTATDYLRFGRSLMNPLFSGFAGFADGIYSTLWGDGLCGGFSSLTFAWNQQPMMAGYLSALIPTALILTGAVIAIIRFIRKPSSELFLLLGFCAVIVLGLDFHDAKSSLLRASESVLRIIGPHAALFLWRPRLGNADSRTRAFAICSWCILAHLGDEQFRHLLDCSFGAAAFVCCKSLRQPE